MSIPSPARRASRRRPGAVTAAVTLLFVVAVGSVSAGCGSATVAAPPSHAATGSALTADSPTLSPTVSPTQQPSPTPTPSPQPTPAYVAATTDGVLLPASQAALATRHPIAIMIDDQALARPQSGLSQADIVYQAPAEGGIPRYEAIFQTQDPKSIGPIRSTRWYFVGWAAEWRAMLTHVGGSANGLRYLRRLENWRVWDADEYRWGGSGYMFRISTRFAPHNCYTTSPKLRSLATKVGASGPFKDTAWTFGDAAAPDARPTGGTLVVPYPENRITYKYDAATNTYPRSVSGEGAQIDAGNGKRVAPSNVVVLYMKVGQLPNDGPGSMNEAKGRLEIGYVGSGTASVFANGVAIAAKWSKPTEFAPTVFLYASGPNAGKPIPLVRGQIFVQVVPIGTAVKWTPGH